MMPPSKKNERRYIVEEEGEKFSSLSVWHQMVAEYFKIKMQSIKSNNCETEKTEITRNHYQTWISCSVVSSVQQTSLPTRPPHAISFSREIFRSTPKKTLKKQFLSFVTLLCVFETNLNSISEESCIFKAREAEKFLFRFIFTKETIFIAKDVDREIMNFP